MSTLIAVFRFIALEDQTRNQKEGNYESIKSLQKNTTSAASHRAGADGARSVHDPAGARNAPMWRCYRNSGRGPLSIWLVKLGLRE